MYLFIYLLLVLHKLYHHIININKLSQRGWRALAHCLHGIIFLLNYVVTTALLLLLLFYCTTNTQCTDRITIYKSGAGAI